MGVLLPSGFPRQASAYVSVAGVNINFGMPHIESIGLGGGSTVREGDRLTVGPDSVGHDLDTKAIVFGGDTLTATDVAVAAGCDDKIGNPDRVGHLGASVIAQTQSRIKAMLEAVIDQMKTSPAPLPVLLVGGGSVIAPSELNGVSKVICPPFHSVANAVGAAMSKVGGSVDAIQSTANQSAAEIVEKAKATAIERAVAAGAIRDTVYVAEVDALPLQYVANQIRVIARAVGELSPDHTPTLFYDPVENGGLEEDEQKLYLEGEKQQAAVEDQERCTPRSAVDISSYRPRVVRNPETGVDEWIISELDLTWLADGCYVLGCAGGGSPFSEYIRIRDQIRQGYVVRVIDAWSLKDDAKVYWGGHMGSPAVSVERLANDETEQAVMELMEYLGHDKVDAFMDLEIGGGNGLQGLALGSSKVLNCPTVDADFMGWSIFPPRPGVILSVTNGAVSQAEHIPRTGKQRSAHTQRASWSHA